MDGGSLTGTGHKGMAALAPRGQQQQVEGLGKGGTGSCELWAQAPHSRFERNQGSVLVRIPAGAG